MAYPGLDEHKRLEAPVWHIHRGSPPAEDAHVTFGVLLNLASVCNTEDRAVLWQFISRYRPAAEPQTSPILDRLVDHAISLLPGFRQARKALPAADG